MASNFDEIQSSTMGDDGYDTSAPLQKTGVQLNAGQKFMKYTLVAINTIFLIFAIVLMAVGAAAMNGAVLNLAGQTIPEGIIAIGVFILLLSLLGFFSAYKEWRIGLGIYFVFVSIFTIILLAVGIAVYVKKNQADYYLSQAWIASCPTPTGATAVNCTQSGIVPNIQKALQCCGLNAYKDQYSAFDSTCPANPTSACLPGMVSTFQNSFSSAGGAAIAFAVIMLVSLLFIGLLMRGIRITRSNRQMEQLREQEAATQAKYNGVTLPDNVL